ncbi:MAG: hypothetical protein PHS97_01850 [Oscillospiraceae bacterium]|nr:hypothetical protein [Oscillospiraceae bacterium]
MPNYLNENGYICYTKGQTPYSASHGWQDINYGEEERLVNEVVNEKMKALTRTLESALPRIVSEYSHQVFQRLITSLVGALEVDVQSEVKIALSNAADIQYLS